MAQIYIKTDMIYPKTQILKHCPTLKGIMNYKLNYEERKRHTMVNTLSTILFYEQNTRKI